ncbi:two-component response regulator [Crocosphaera subtropica ATCC 51142]|uniref:Two-component response regulator n=1 Tax=Crocosphaera subtropica (strain ATCC 51142 / BH68) TaxID=43989 RepID=B1WVD6_CROS5|nr:diguanylate cyclase [Crocosphaera subtropica]ACB53926.1 two-component response regulator [Crocosphaera subtropica ATCC 51142]
MKNLDPFKPEDFLILVVDDIRKNLQLLIEILDTSGYGTTFAISGKQALERAKVTEPDLILLDLMMPEMNGLEVCKQLKKNAKTEQIPVIFLTAATETNYLIEAFESGAVDYVTKPFKTPELLARIKTHLDLKRTKDELKKAYEEMKRIAATDELTGIPNRRSIFSLGKQEFERSQRYNSSFSLLIIDVDKFKTINDTYGHDIGDEALKMMVKITLNCLRKVDYIGRLETEEEALAKKGHLGRLGGEEFVVILPHTNLKGAYKAAQRVCEAMTKETLQVEDKTVSITVSIGIATYDSKDQKMEDILKRADLALFAAKENGRNRVAIMHNEQLKVSQ